MCKSKSHTTCKQTPKGAKPDQRDQDQAVAVFLAVVFTFLLATLIAVTGCVSHRPSQDYYQRLYSDMCFYALPPEEGTKTTEDDLAQLRYYAARCAESKEMERYIHE